MSEDTPILQETYNALKPGVRNWIEEDLRWKREEISGINLENEILDDGHEEVDGKKWAKWKIGKHVDVTIWRNKKEQQYARFIRLDTGDWQKEKEADLTPFVNTFAPDLSKMPPLDVTMKSKSVIGSDSA